MHRKALLFLLLVFSALSSDARDNQLFIDSLLKASAGLRDDTNKVNLLNVLSRAYATTNPDSGIQYGGQSLALAERLGFDKGIANADNEIGVNYRAKSDYSKALEYYFAALKINERQGNKRYAASNLGNIGDVYTAVGNYPKALEYDLQALSIFQKTSDEHRAATMLQNISNIYIPLGDYAKALEYAFQSLKINGASNSKDDIALNLSNIGNIYASEKNYPKALEYDYKVLEMNNELGNKRICAITLGNVGEAWLSVAKDTTLNINDYAAYGIKGRSDCLDKATQYLNNGIGACKEIGFTDNVMEFSQYLSEAYSLTGNYKGAYDNLKLYTNLKDTVFSAQNNMKIASLELTREKELRERIDAQHNKFLLVAGILLLAIGILVVNRRLLKVRKNREIRAAKERLLQSEKMRVEEELQNAQIQLERYLKSINEKNELIEQIHDKINKDAIKDSQSEDEKYLYLQQLTETNLLTDKDWAEFKTLFVKVHKGFFTRLYEKYPQLSEAEIRILALAKLNISTKQMAGMLGISPSSVLTARYRLRKKMNLHEDISLEAI